MCLVKQLPALFLSTLLILTAGFGAVPAAAETVPRLQIHPLSRESIPVYIKIAGTVAALKTAQLSAQIPGRVLFIGGKEGDRFSWGGRTHTNRRQCSARQAGCRRGPARCGAGGHPQRQRAIAS